MPQPSQLTATPEISGMRKGLSPVPFFAVLAWGMLGAPFDASAATADSVKQYDITWSFSAPRTVGKFANGDWWVVGPVTITNISPRTDDGSANSNFGHGSMLNPIPGQTQGFYNQPVDPAYDAAKNLALRLPITIQPGNSVFSTMTNPDTYKDSDRNGRLDDDAERVYFKETAVLTVLASEPAPGSFRPPYAGTDKTIKPNWNSSNINYSTLRSLQIPIPSNAPSLAFLEEATRRPVLEMHYNWNNSDWKSAWSYGKAGSYPRRTYGREVAGISSGAGLMLNTNLTNAQKQKLAINMVQWGIDVYGLLNAGMQWQPNGGHNLGRLLPLYLAGKLLNDPQLLAKAKGTSPFQEMNNHFFVTPAIINKPRSPNTPPPKPYTQDMLGMPEWCHKFPGDPNDSAAWDNYSDPGFYASGYRFINGGPNCGTVATILLMGGRSEIDQEAFFKYHIERFYPRSRPTGNGGYSGNSNSIEFFVRDMWDVHINGGTPPTYIPPTDPPPGPNPVPAFAVGDRIQVWGRAAVKSAANSTSAAGYQDMPNLGTVVEVPAGPDAQNITWYRIDYDNGVDGWSSQADFNKSLSPPATSFKKGDTIKVWRQTWVNSTASITTDARSMPADSTGRILDGPRTNGNDNIIWFQIDYGNNIVGWSGADNLTKIGSLVGLPRSPAFQDEPLILTGRLPQGGHTDTSEVYVK
jgi:hypothetical protein